MQKTLFLFLFLMGAITAASGQQTWETIQIEGFGSIDLPPNMEVQSDTFRAAMAGQRGGIKAPPFTAVFQQKYLNIGHPNSLKTYAKLSVKTKMDTLGAYQKLADFHLSKSALEAINEKNKKESYDAASIAHFEILKWYPAKIASYSGYKVVTMRYIRKAENSPPALVEICYIYNNDRLHTLVFAYRLADESTWKPTFKQIKKTLKIKVQ